MIEKKTREEFRANELLRNLLCEHEYNYLSNIRYERTQLKIAVYVSENNLWCFILKMMAAVQKRYTKKILHRKKRNVFIVDEWLGIIIG